MSLDIAPIFKQNTHTLSAIETPPVAGVMADLIGESVSPRGTLQKNHTPNDSTLPVVSDTTSTGLLDPEDEAPLSAKQVAKALRTRVAYDEKFVEKMLNYFMSVEKSRETIDTYTWKSGEVSEKTRNIPNPPPSFSEFGRSIGVSENTLKNWAKKHDLFGEAYDMCQDIVQEFFVHNGVRGDYSGQFAIFAAKNLTKMKDVQINKNENYDMKAVLDSLEKAAANGTTYEQSF